MIRFEEIPTALGFAYLTIHDQIPPSDAMRS